MLMLSSAVPTMGSWTLLTYFFREANQPGWSPLDVNGINCSINWIGNVDTTGIIDIEWNLIQDGTSPLPIMKGARGFINSSVIRMEQVWQVNLIVLWLL